MNVKILPAKLAGVADAIPSKSQAHRALICAALADKPTRIGCKVESDDIAATSACLSALGAAIARDPYGYNANPITREKSGGAALLPCAESGSTFRFLLPVVCALGRSASFLPKGRLSERPLSPLYEELTRRGCALSPQGSVPFHVSGRLLPGKYSMDGGVSSQFTSGLLFALPLLDDCSEIHLTGSAESLPYIELTRAMQDTFNIRTESDGRSFFIPGRQTYHSPGVVDVEGDWSNAAFWLAAGAVGAGGVACTGLDRESRQGDRAITELLTRFGARLEWNGPTVSIRGGNLRGIEIDARNIPDLVPILAVVGAVSDGITVIRNAGRLRAKESDRLTATSGLLRGLGADVSETDDALTVYGASKLTGGRVFSHNDHRIAMSAAIAATICAEPVIIQGAEAVSKSYPGFFDDMKALGGRVCPLTPA